MRHFFAVGLAGSLLLAALPALAARGVDEGLRTGPAIELAALTAPGAADASACGDPSEIGANEDCTLALDDEVMLAAELLLGKLGAAALDFALERAARHDADADEEAAELWRRIAATVGEMAALSGKAVSNR